MEEKVLEEIRTLDLKIPKYQRPYKWRKEHVIQLLDDLYENIYQKSNNLYRAGSIIIHKENADLNIVDGQQRLVTLTLIFQFLKKEKNIDSDLKLLFGAEFKNTTSKNNIKYNYQIIKNWFNSKSFNVKDLQYFATKITSRLQFVLVTVFHREEAFQLFDSQNSRGKELYVENLLKAFHLREMEKDGYSEKDLEKYSVKWDDYILDEKKLINILGNHLFRIRKWTKGEKQYTFSKLQINEFKGISLSSEVIYNYDLSFRILEGYSQNAKNDYLLRNFHIPSKFPFQITMPIINGKNFFDYVFHYLELKGKIFNDLEKNRFNLFYKQLCLGNSTNEEYYIKDFNYGKSLRTGDVKVRNLFENICLLFVDRFGIKNFDKIYFEEFYKNAYQLRLDKKAINDNTIINYEKGQKFFKLISNSYSPEEIHSNLFCNYSPNKPWTNLDFVSGTEDMYKFLKGDKNVE
ncbi:DUF262 domain-containing protein [Chryseobacterium sp. SC28]|uniref:DUF262 domain-containing protein n=1 Tax=Chryseobacterium sp. SC28 TaxID=2268028 RepID=UPI001E5C9822|nr:DUF262 domain-containing protein [Chryseobacterium sp. SC28]